MRTDDLMKAALEWSSQPLTAHLDDGAAPEVGVYNRVTSVEDLLVEPAERHDDAHRMVGELYDFFSAYEASRTATYRHRVRSMVGSRTALATRFVEWAGGAELADSSDHHILALYATHLAEAGVPPHAQAQIGRGGTCDPRNRREDRGGNAGRSSERGHGLGAQGRGRRSARQWLHRPRGRVRAPA